jgi:signal transduction histidine kinase
MLTRSADAVVQVEPRRDTGHQGLVAIALVVVAVLATRAHSYVLFHSLAELFSVVIGLTAFSIAWNTRHNIQSGFLLVVGLTFGPVAAIDLLHTLAYKGLGVFPDADANLPTQLWVAGRVLEVGALVAAAALANAKPNPYRVALAGILGMAALLATIFWLGIFPDCWRADSGLTPFKVGVEYLFMLLLGAALVRLWRLRRVFPPDLFPFVAASVALVIAEEACFTLYTDVYGALNMAGHMLKVASFVLVYAGLVRFGFTRPQETLYRRLNELNARLAEDVLRSNERASLALAAVEGAAWDWDMQSPQVMLTPQHGVWLGCEGVPTLADLAGCLSPTDADALDRLVAPRSVGEARAAEVRLEPPGRPTRWLRMVTKVIPSPGDGAPIMIGFDVEVTSRKTAELERERLLRALESSHAELQRFAEVLAHHLQEPVKRQLRFCQLLQRSLPSPLPDDSREALAFIVDGGERLSELLRAVQLYLSIDALPASTPCSADRALDRALAHMAGPLRACGAAVERAPLPDLRLSLERLTDLFEILLANALEYRDPTRPLRLRVGVEAQPGAVHIALEDNGVGIDERYLEKIFGVFERLHTRAAHPGTGIGLAVARKIAESAGGQLWASSIVGQGSTFHLRFPLERSA